MLSLRFDDDVVMTLKDDATTVNAIVCRAPRANLEERRFGDWSAIELIAHVTYIAEAMRHRIERCLAENTPALESVPDGALGDERDPLRLARRLQSEHARIVGLLMQPGASERPATHPEWGRVNAGFFAYHAKHSHEHIVELAKAFPPS